MRTLTKSALIFIAVYAISTGASAHMGTDLHSHSSFLTGLAAGHDLGGSAFAAIAGMVLTTAVLHLAVVALGRTLSAPPVWATRITGVAVASSGVALLLQLI
jgi:hydrogenase/urease accessory protein HupE